MKNKKVKCYLLYEVWSETNALGKIPLKQNKLDKFGKTNITDIYSLSKCFRAQPAPIGCSAAELVKAP
jgi:hypothetical protein